MARGEVQEARQHGARLDRAGGHELRNRQQFQPRLVGIQRRKGQHAVGRAEVDSNDVFCGHDYTTYLPSPFGSGLHSYRNSTSAGATILRRPESPDQVGNSQIVASQPGWTTGRERAARRPRCPSAASGRDRNRRGFPPPPLPLSATAGRKANSRSSTRRSRGECRGPRRRSGRRCSRPTIPERSQRIGPRAARRPTA